MSKSFILLIICLGAVLSDNLPIDGRCAYMINKGSSLALTAGNFDQFNPSNVIFSQFKKSLDQVMCFWKRTDGSFYIFPFKMQNLMLRIGSTEGSVLQKSMIYSSFLISQVDANSTDYRIKSTDSDQSLALAYDQPSQLVIQNKFSGLCSQKWNFIDEPQATFNFIGCYYLQNQGKYLSWGNDCNSPVQFVDSISAASVSCFATVPNGKQYTISSKSVQKCSLGISGTFGDKQAIIKQATMTSTNQLFNFIPTGSVDSNQNPIFNIGTNTGKSLDVVADQLQENPTSLTLSSQNWVFYLAN